LSIGLGVLLVVMEGLWLKTNKPVYHQMARFWTKVFALTFAIGVATGIVMEFEFGTNWATYSRFVGDVFGSALAAEGIFAFFLESGFLARVVVRLGQSKPQTALFLDVHGLPRRAFQRHLDRRRQFVDANTAGYHLVIRNGAERAEITNFWELVFNPSSMDRCSTRSAARGRRARFSLSA